MPSGNVATIESKRELTEFLAAHPLCVVDFYATWCGPCMAIKGKYAALSAKYSSVGFAQVNVDEATELAEQYRVKSLPTFLCFFKGQKLRCIEGADLASVEGVITSQVAKLTAAPKVDAAPQDPKKLGPKQAKKLRVKQQKKTAKSTK